MSYDDDTMTRDDMWDALESLGVEEQAGFRAFHQIED